MTCTSYTLVDYESFIGRAWPMPCKRWTCDECRPMRARQLAADIMAGKPNVFVTLTVNPRCEATPNRRARALHQAFKTLKKRIDKEAHRDPKKKPRPYAGWTQRLQEKYGDGTCPNLVTLPSRTFQYLWVCEATEQGEAHIHLFGRADWIDQAWLSGQMADLIQSPIVHINRLKTNKKAALYAAKYAGKALVKYEGCKRYSKSQNYCTPRKDRVEQMEQYRCSVTMVREHYYDFKATRECLPGWLGEWDGIAYFRNDVAPPSGADPPNAPGGAFGAAFP